MTKRVQRTTIPNLLGFEIPHRKVISELGVEELPESVSAEATRQGSETKIEPSMRGWHGEFLTGMDESLKSK